MPDAGDKARVEIEVAIRDMYSAAFKSMADGLRNMNKMAQELGQGAGSSFNKVKRESDQLHESTKRSGATLASMNTIVAGLTQNLTGPVGLIAGFYSAAKSVESFAVGRVQLQNFSTDIGASVRMINSMSAAMDKAGISAEEQRQSMSKLGGLVQDLAARGQGSTLDTLLRETGVKEAERQKLIETARKDIDKGIAETIVILNRGSAALRSYRSNQVQVHESTLQALQHHQEERNKVYEIDLVAAQKWHNRWTEISQGMSNTWARMYDTFLKTVAKIPDEKFDSITKEVEKRKGILPDEKSIFGRMLSGDWGNSFKERFPGEGAFPKNDQLAKALSDKSATFAERFPKEGDFGKARDLIDIQRDSNKTLLDIRDILQGGAGGGGGGGTYGTGIRGATAAGGGPGAARAGLGGFRAVRPGGIGAVRSGGGSGGITAAAGTPVQGGMATVTTPDGKSLQVDPQFKDNFQGFINDYYQAGGKFGPDTGTLGSRPSNASGHPIGDAIDVNQIGRGIRSKKGVTLAPDVEDSLAEKWGMVSGNKWRDNDQGHFGIRSAKAARDALVNQGMTPSEAEAKTGLNSVKGSFFTDQRTASGRSAATTPGIALPSREGLGKMYEVTGPDGKKMMLPQIDVGPAKWTGRGIDISGAAADAMGYGRDSFPTDKKFSYRQMDGKKPTESLSQRIDSSIGDVEAARQRIDKTESLSQRIDASMSATVDFKNMPSWVRSSIEDNGKFKKLSVTRSGPQNGKAGNALSEPNKWSYE